MSSTLGWIANVLLLVGMWQIGYQRRSAFLWTCAGDGLWAIRGWGEWDLFSICVLFSALALWNWWIWSKYTRVKDYSAPLPLEPIHIIRGVPDEILEHLAKVGIARKIHPPLCISNDELDRQIDTDAPIRKD